MALMRTDYWAPVPPSVRGGDTSHNETLIDIESYLLPMDKVRGSSLFGWGVADGLAVTATVGRPTVTIATGSALDGSGHLMVLASGGFAVVDPNADPSQSNVQAVPVGDSGVALTTGGLTGSLLLTLSWREVLSPDTQLALLHAPWLRLVKPTDFQDLGQQVVLAQVDLDPNGAVLALSPGLRRLVGVPAGRLELRAPQSATGPAVTQAPVGELRGRSDGGLDLNLLAPGGVAHPVLTVQAPTGNVGLGTATPTAALEINRGPANDPALRLSSSGTGWGSGLQLANSTAGARTYGTYAGADGTWHFTDWDAQADRLVIDQSGRIGIGIGANQAKRVLHVEGSEVHSGGPGGGFSFADQTNGALIENPTQGERWRWYARDGFARLWSGSDLLTVGLPNNGSALDVGARMRVRQGSDQSAGIWFSQNGTGDAGLVGMADESHIGLLGNNGGGWGLRMDTASGAVLFGNDYGRPDGPSTLSLWGSRIGDVGNGILFLRSGGGVVAFDSNESVGIGTTSPLAKLDVHGDGTTISAHSTGGAFSAAVFADSPTIGMWANSSNTALLAAGSNTAGSFLGNVNITGTLSKGGGGFRIDHPHDPANRYLSHSFVESPEMLNVYNGTVVTDAAGTATVVLPEYFQTLNRDYCYQLTPIGEPTLASVVGEVRENSFTIRTERPGTRVCWQITGIRQDPWANAHRITVEETKPAEERDLYLHPELHNQPAGKHVTTLLTGTQ